VRIHILSDLHVEFGEFVPPPVDADVVVLAGDTHVGMRGLSWAQNVFTDHPVLYVLGNHEFYGQATPRLVQKLKSAAEGTNVHVLENDPVDLGGCTFLGATLWSDFELCGDRDGAAYEAQQAMTDYRRIRVSPNFRRLRPSDTAALHFQTRAWLREATHNTCGKIVVVTHHAPSARSLPEIFRDDVLSSAYASAMDRDIEELGVGLWIHGHLHTSSDYRIGSTRVICNPRGYYPDELNPGFNPDLTIEL